MRALRVTRRSALSTGAVKSARVEILVTSLWPIFAAIIVGHLGARMTEATPAVVVSLTAAAFLAIMLLQPVVYGDRPASGSLPPKVEDRALGVAVLFLAISVGMTSGPRTLHAAAIVIAAAVEEYVFRWVLPKRLFMSLASTRLSVRHRISSSWILAQVLFTICHFLAPGTSWSFGYAARLFVAGLLYCNLVARLGVSAAIAVHSSMNVGLERSLGFWSHEVAFGLLLAGSAAIALVGIWSHSARSRLISPSASSPYLPREATT